ncbi:MAG: hypothetical protein JWQ04_205 [Pedosphaera sp.]|nr:hypothetical protein [Pedosphaera sp.]
MGEEPNRPEARFFTFAGKLRTPFFGDIKVQLLITPSSGGGSTPVIGLAGGWPEPDGNGADMGWNINKANFFNTTSFDPQQYGYPLAAGSVGNYINSTNEMFHPRAQRNWLDVAQFDYPLQWDPVLRQFHGFAEGKVSLLVLDLNSSLKHLSPGNIDFDFSQDLNVQLPGLKTLDLANDAVNELNGPLSSLSNALRQVFGQELDTTGLTRGFQSLQKTLREGASDFFQPILQPALQGAVNDLDANLAKFRRRAPGQSAGIPGQHYNRHRASDQ